MLFFIRCLKWFFSWVDIIGETKLKFCNFGFDILKCKNSLLKFIFHYKTEIYTYELYFLKTKIFFNNFESQDFQNYSQLYLRELQFEYKKVKYEFLKRELVERLLKFEFWKREYCFFFNYSFRLLLRYFLEFYYKFKVIKIWILISYLKFIVRVLIFACF